MDPYLQKILAGLSGMGQNPQGDPLFKDPNTPYKPMDEIPRPNNPQVSSIPGGQEDPNDINAMIDKLYPQEHAMADKFTAIWDQMPTREKPGKLKHILAAVSAGLTQDPKAGNYVLNHDYDEKMSDWETKLKTLQPAMTDERYSNTNNRIMQTSAGTQKISQQRADIAKGELDRKSKADEERNTIAQKKLELERFKVDHPDYEFIKDQATGKVMAKNPKNPSEPPIDSGLTFDNFSELEKAQWRIKEAMAPRTINSSSTTETIGGPDSGPSPNDEKTRRYNRAQQIYNQYPDFQQYITLGDPGSNTFTLSDDAPDQVRSLVNAKENDISLDGKAPSKISTTNRTSTSSRGSTAPPTIGNKGTVPPIEKRTVGMEFTFPNGNVGKWDGTKWIVVSLKTK